MRDTVLGEDEEKGLPPIRLIPAEFVLGLVSIGID